MFNWVLSTSLAQFYDILTFRFPLLYTIQLINMSGEDTKILNAVLMNLIPWKSPEGENGWKKDQMHIKL